MCYGRWQSTFFTRLDVILILLKSAFDKFQCAMAFGNLFSNSSFHPFMILNDDWFVKKKLLECLADFSINCMWRLWWSWFCSRLWRSWFCSKVHLTNLTRFLKIAFIVAIWQIWFDDEGTLPKANSTLVAIWRDF